MKDQECLNNAINALTEVLEKKTQGGSVFKTRN